MKLRADLVTELEDLGMLYYNVLSCIETEKCIIFHLNTEEKIDAFALENLMEAEFGEYDGIYLQESPLSMFDRDVPYFLNKPCLELRYRKEEQ